MPLSYAQVQGNGTQKNFDVPCEYLSKSHISVRVDGVDVSFTWIDTYRLMTTTAPVAGTVVEVRRTTPREDRLVTFTDGSTLVETDLNTSTLQSFFLAQEAFDQGAASMGVTEDGQFSALLRRVTNMADPQNNQDAVTKGWALDTTNTNVALGVAAKDRAIQAETNSKQSETVATSAAGTTVAARDATVAARDTTLGHRDAAASSSAGASSQRGLAQAARDASEGFKTGSETARNEAVVARNETQGFRNEAETFRNQAESAAAGVAVPSGAVMPFYRSTAPTGWLLANGSAVSRTTYAALWQAMGSPNTGNGTTTFALPDLRGEFIRGLDSGRAVDSGRTLGSAQAQEVQAHGHTASSASAGSHSHTGSANSAGDHTHPMPAVVRGYQVGGGQGWAAGTGVDAREVSQTNSAGAHTHTLMINSGGAHTHNITVDNSTGVETRPRNVALLYCIKT